MNTSHENWAEMPRPIVCLAPMDGITDSAYRRIVRSFSKSVVLFSEFTSADGFLRAEKVRQRLVFAPEEHPYFVQLFGNNPLTFTETAKIMEQQGVAGVDINMGCPSKKIVHSQHGSGLMRDVNQACRIVEAVANNCGIQVSVKTRLGWSNADNLHAFTSSLVDAGASLITIHGRTYNQGFTGLADWAPIHDLKSRLSVPVLGNGDVKNHQEGMQGLGNLDGFMIGRAAIGNPWAFLPDQQSAQPGMGERVAVIRRHYDLLREAKPEIKALIEFRKHLVGYLKGFGLAKTARLKLLQARDEPTFFHLLSILADDPAALARAS